MKAHLSLLLGLLALVKGVGYYLDRYELTLSGHGFITGATYTDISPTACPSASVIVSVFCFGLLISNIWHNDTYPIIAGPIGASRSLAGTLYPALVQRFQVEPSESAKEAPYIERNIEMTRLAMGLADVTPRISTMSPPHS